MIRLKVEWRGLGAGGFTGEFGAHGGEEVDHGQGDACGFGSTIHSGSETTFLGLFGVIEKENLMDDRHTVSGGGALKRVCDGGTDKISVFGGTTKDDSQCNNGIWWRTAEDEFGADGDFEGTRDTVGSDGDIWSHLLQFIFGSVQQAFDIGLIVEAGDNGDGQVLLGGAGAVRDGAGHGEGGGSDQ